MVICVPIEVITLKLSRLECERRDRLSDRRSLTIKTKYWIDKQLQDHYHQGPTSIPLPMWGHLLTWDCTTKTRMKCQEPLQPEFEGFRGLVMTNVSW